MSITVKDPNKGQNFELKADGKRLKSIQQNSINITINGVNTMATKLEVASAIEVLEIILPINGFWKTQDMADLEKRSLVFFPKEGTCAEFKILIK